MQIVDCTICMLMSYVDVVKTFAERYIGTCQNTGKTRTKFAVCDCRRAVASAYFCEESRSLYEWGSSGHAWCER